MKQKKPYPRQYFNGRLYRAWRNMKNRCTNPNRSNFRLYGGRGISVCRSWEFFANFLSWALKSGYTDQLELDRKDSDKNYAPSNCRWVTQLQQNQNRRGWVGGHGFKGVTQRDSRFRAYIRVAGKRIHLGYFDSPEQAARVYDGAAKEYFGQFARLNFI